MTRRRPTPRRVLVFAHRWLGVVLGLHLALLGASGVYLALHRPIDVALAHRSEVADRTATLADVVSAARTALSTEREPRSITVPPPGSRADWVVAFDLTEPGQRRRIVNAYVDAGTGEVRETRDAGRTLYGVLFGFHHDLFAGPIGHSLVAISGLLSLVIVLSGLVILWPRRLAHLGSLFFPRPFRTPRGLSWDLHRSVGVWALVVLAVVISSGIVIAQPRWFGGAASRRPAATDQVAVDYAAIERALSELPTEVRALRLAPTAVTVEHAEGTLALDPTTAAPLPPSEPARGLAPTMRSVHTGAWGGAFGTGVTVLAGLVAIVLWGTGLVAMISRNLRKRRAAARAA